jgi:uroporphyrinogen decarboxylase
MTGKELIIRTMKHEEVERIPWVPFAGVHAGKLKGYTAAEVLKDADKLLECLTEVHRLYMPDGMPVVFDLQLEAEILGCELMWADDNPPSVMSHPMEEKVDFSRLIESTDGRLPTVMDVTKRLKASVGETTALYGLFCGPLTLASHLRGTQLFMDMKKRPEDAEALFDYALENCLRMVDFYIEAGVDILAPVDPLISQISPKNFEQFMTKVYSRLFDYIREKGKFSSFFVCGNALKNIPLMCETNPDALSVDENLTMSVVKDITDKYNVVIGGNIPLTTTMLFGNQMDNMKCVVDLVDSVSIKNKNFIVAPGCDMPYDIPIENAIAVSDAVRNIATTRERLKDYQAVSDDIEIILPDYANLEKPLIEAFTLDSASCAACQYMWEMVKDAKNKYGDAIDVIEYKYNVRENIARCKKIGVPALPTLYINGKPTYISIIPSHDELYSKIEGLIK